MHLRAHLMVVYHMHRLSDVHKRQRKSKQNGRVKLNNRLGLGGGKMIERGVLEKMRHLWNREARVRAFNDSDLSKMLRCHTEQKGPR